MTHQSHDDVSPEAVLASVEAALGAAFGSEPQRASVSFLGVEPIQVLRFDEGEVISYVSLGMSRRPMTAAEASAITDAGPRAELLVQVRADGGQLWRHLAVLAAAPVVEGVVYTEGMSVDVGATLNDATRCTGGLIVTSALAPCPTDAGPVDFLRLLPATSTELAWARVHGAARLRDRWQERHTDLLDLNRPAVPLD